MTPERLDQILEKIPEIRIAVIGDFFLDRYFDIDRSLAETSLETGLEAHQVVNVRCYPGAAGNTAVGNMQKTAKRMPTMHTFPDNDVSPYRQVF